MKNLLRPLFCRNQLEADMAEEMRAHIEEQTQRNIAAGMSETDARAAALRRFGGVAQTQERARDVLLVRGWDDLVRDVKIGTRALRRNAGFTIATTLTIALGTAAVAVVGLFFNAIVWSDLPHVREPDRVVEVLSHTRNHPWNIRSVSGPVVRAWKEQAQSFEQIAAYTFRGDVLAARDARDFKGGLIADPELFTVLDVAPAIGRLFTADDTRSASPRTVIISDALWTQFFDRRPEAIGSRLLIGQIEHTVIGVMPPRFEFPHSHDYWLPLAWEGAPLSDRRARLFEVVARLHDDVSTEEASAEMAALAGAEARHAPEEDEEFTARVVPAWERITISFRHDVHVFFFAALVLQILVSLNVGGLLFSRFLRRSPQTVMRAALGASRTRLMREMLVECLLLASAGWGAGLLLAYAMRPWAIAAVTPDYPFPRSFVFAFRPSVFALTAAATLGTMLMVGLLPAWRYSRLRLAEGVRAGAMILSAKPQQTRLRSCAVVAQVSGTVALLVYCGLRLQELRALRATDLGVDPRGVAMFSIVPSRTGPPQENATYLRRLLTELRQTPGLQAAGLGSSMPGQFERMQIPFAIAGQPVDPAQQPRVLVRAISPGTLDALRIPLLQGRDFNEHDTPHSEPVVLIDRVTAEHFFRDENPLGRRIATTASQTAPQWATIVGVVAPTRHFAQFGSPQPTIYVNWLAQHFSGLPSIFIRGVHHPRLVLAAATDVMKRFDPTAAVLTPAHGIYARQIAASYWNFQWRGNVMATFAGVAHFVAAVGIFGLVAYTVAERTREIGIRQALGATRDAVVRQAAWRGLRLVLCGSAIGVILTVTLTRAFPLYVTSLYRTNRYEPSVYGSVLLALLLVGTVACYLPARRAAKVDPVIALRAE